MSLLFSSSNSSFSLTRIASFSPFPQPLSQPAEITHHLFYLLFLFFILFPFRIPHIIRESKYDFPGSSLWEEDKKKEVDVEKKEEEEEEKKQEQDV
jgi:hypothetical protein